MRIENSMQEYLKGLNEPQREAVMHVKGPIMIVAGAGSGTAADKRTTSRAGVWTIQAVTAKVQV